MTSPNHHALDPLRRCADALNVALQSEKPAIVTAMVLAARADLQRLAGEEGEATAGRLAHLSEGLRQIDRAARAGQSHQARLVLAHWRKSL